MKKRNTHKQDPIRAELLDTKVISAGDYVL